MSGKFRAYSILLFIMHLEELREALYAYLCYIAETSEQRVGPSQQDGR